LLDVSAQTIAAASPGLAVYALAKLRLALGQYAGLRAGLAVGDRLGLLLAAVGVGVADELCAACTFGIAGTPLDIARAGAAGAIATDRLGLALTVEAGAFQCAGIAVVLDADVVLADEVVGAEAELVAWAELEPVLARGTEAVLAASAFEAEVFVEASTTDLTGGAGGARPLDADGSPAIDVVLGAHGVTRAFQADFLDAEQARSAFGFAALLAGEALILRRLFVPTTDQQGGEHQELDENCTASMVHVHGFNAR